MAKKAKAKKRAASPAAPVKKEGETTELGSISIAVQVEATVHNTSPWNELVIEWACLGLSAEPDQVEDRSGNAHLLDPNRPIITDAEGMHIYLKELVPPGGAATFGFNLFCTYNEAVQARVAAPVLPGEPPPTELPPPEGETPPERRYRS